jgi:hypothetical protein
MKDDIFLPEMRHAAHPSFQWRQSPLLLVYETFHFGLELDLTRVVDRRFLSSEGYYYGRNL